MDVWMDGYLGWAGLEGTYGLMEWKWKWNRINGQTDGR